MACSGSGAAHALHALIDGLVDYVFPILNKVDQRVHAIEEALFESNARQVIQEIALLRRDIISLRRIIRGQIPIVQQLETCEHPILARAHGRVLRRYRRPPLQAARHRR